MAFVGSHRQEMTEIFTLRTHGKEGTSINMKAKLKKKLLKRKKMSRDRISRVETNAFRTTNIRGIFLIQGFSLGGHISKVVLAPGQ